PVHAVHIRSGMRSGLVFRIVTARQPGVPKSVTFWRVTHVTRHVTFWRSGCVTVTFVYEDNVTSRIACPVTSRAAWPHPARRRSRLGRLASTPHVAERHRRPGWVLGVHRTNLNRISGLAFGMPSVGSFARLQ